MTEKEAWDLCLLLSESAFTYSLSGWRQPSQYFIDNLKDKYPPFNWRVIIDRSGERTRWSLTIDDNDKREHYVPIDGTCIHCSKTAKEIGVEERDDG